MGRPAPAKKGQRAVSAQEERGQICIQVPSPVVEGGGNKGLISENAGVVDQDVKAAQLAPHNLEQPLDLLDLRHIRPDHQRATRNLLRRLAQSRFLPGDQYESCTLVSQTLGNGQTDSSAAPGHQNDFAVEFTHKNRGLGARGEQ